MRSSSLFLTLAALAAAAPAAAQDMDVAPSAVAKPAVAVAVAPAAQPDGNVAPYYAANPGKLLWLRLADGRAAAAKLVELLNHAALDGLRSEERV